MLHYEEQTADTFKWPWNFLIQPFLRWMRGFFIFEVALMISVGHAQKKRKLEGSVYLIIDFRIVLNIIVLHL